MVSAAGEYATELRSASRRGELLLVGIFGPPTDIT
jgi:hypothetical protein